MTGRRVLVTGAAGRLGSRVVAELTSRGDRVVALVQSPGGAERLESLERFDVGNAHNPEVAAAAVAGVDAVVHLAAIPAPGLDRDHIVFGNNTLATFCILDAAAKAGVPTAVIASSFSATGLPFSPYGAEPQWLPIDEAMPTQAADPYALSKITDEATAATISRSSGMTTTALRLPFLATPDDRLAEQAATLAANPGIGRADLWSYLDTRDAARAVALALDRTGGDSMVIGVGAPDNLTPYPTEALLDRFLPSVPRRRRFAGRDTPIDLTLATQILGFRAQHPWPVQPRELPGPDNPGMDQA